MTHLRKAVTTAIVRAACLADARSHLASTLERLGVIDDVEVRQRLAARMASGELVGEAAREAMAGASAPRESGAFGARARREVKGHARVRARLDLRELRDEIDELLRALDDD